MKREHQQCRTCKAQRHAAVVLPRHPVRPLVGAAPTSLGANSTGAQQHCCHVAPMKRTCPRCNELSRMECGRQLSACCRSLLQLTCLKCASADGQRCRRGPLSAVMGCSSSDSTGGRVTGLAWRAQLAAQRTRSSLTPCP